MNGTFKRCTIRHCPSVGRINKGLCPRHYQELRRTGSIKSLADPKICREEHCDKPTYAKGLCLRHYQSDFSRKTYGHKPRPVYASECTMDGCSSPAKTRGLCSHHYYAVHQRDKLGWKKREVSPEKCTVPDCGNPHKAKGLCNNHYNRRLYHRKKDTEK